MIKKIIPYVKKNKKIYDFFLSLFLLWGGCKMIITHGSYASPNYFLFQEQKLIFVIMYKCGCSSVLHSLLYLQGEQKYNSMQNGRDIHELCFFSRIKILESKHLDGEYTLFTVIRDPLERIISYYLDGKRTKEKYPSKVTHTSHYLFGYLSRNDKTFNIFLEKLLKIPPFLQDVHFKPMSKNIGGERVIEKTMLLHLDTLNEDFEPIRKKYSLPKLSVHNSTSGNKEEIINNIPEKLLKKFKKAYKEDYEFIERYNIQQGKKVKELNMDY